MFRLAVRRRVRLPSRGPRGRVDNGRQRLQQGVREERCQRLVREGCGAQRSGFIIEGSQIRGPAATCRIKATKEDGDSAHMIAACATDIMLSDVQLSVRSIKANEIVRMFPSMPGMETNYYRCPM